MPWAVDVWLKNHLGQVWAGPGTPTFTGTSGDSDGGVLWVSLWGTMRWALEPECRARERGEEPVMVSRSSLERWVELV